ncbi:MAG: sugar transferase, partial [Tsuneonella sp.]
MNAPAIQALLPEAASGARAGPLVRSFERRRMRIYVVQMLADVASVLCGFMVAGRIVAGWVPTPMAWLQAQLLLPVYLTFALYQGVYSIRSLTDQRFAMRRAAMALAVAAALLFFITYYVKSQITLSRTVM